PASMIEANQRLFGERIGPDEAVRRILADVRERGDAALRAWTEKLDGAALSDLRVRQPAIDAAVEEVDAAVLEALRFAAARIEAFHRRQPNLSWIHNDEEGTLGQLVRPIGRVGIYVPGGTAPLPSTLLMT